MFDGLFPDFERSVFPQREDLESDELFAELLSEKLAHVAEELDCYDSVLLICIVVGHFDYVLEHIVSSFVIGEFFGDVSELFSGFFFDV